MRPPPREEGRIKIFVTAGQHLKGNEKALRETQTLRAGCSKAEPKNFAPPQTHFPGAQDCQNLISYRWSLPSPTDPVWWRSMYTLSSYRGNRPTNKPTNKHTHRQTGPITIHCTAKLSAQCNYKELHEVRSRNNESIGCIKLKLKILVDFWIFTLLVMIQTLGSYRYFR